MRTILTLLVAVLIILAGCTTNEQQIKDIVTQILEEQFVIDTPDPHPDTDTNLIAPTENAVESEPITEIEIFHEWDKINWINADISAWEETVLLKSAKVQDGKLYLDYKANWKPMLYQDGYVAGNLWLIFLNNGKWYASSCEWLRPNQTVKSTKCLAGDHFGSREWDGWEPSEDAKLYVFVSGLARGNVRNVQERSNVVEVER